ncbi:SDR family oxidoreductase [Seleniivibrio sp.]|uniref:SDR family oxidoreductase n=1 Tax=Seleniivibrio sp. TaxID=2898801 RepID=UPI0025D1DE99|nr:SDR family oxidoreductase [Seleniivibrio sp.]MCD8553216.1 SDR family oxidoreductase [Seleniivibrio sp.]
MRIFVTGATGFIGLAVVKELISFGHSVLGLTRSEEGRGLLLGMGADAHHGSLEDIDSLRRGAEDSDAVIHLAFIHDFSKFSENCQKDKAAIEAMGEVLAGSGKPFIVTAGAGGLAGAGITATEEFEIPSDSKLPRVSEQTAMALISKGVSSAVVRLPQVHNTVKQGFVSYLIALARQKGVAAYVDNGSNRWSAGHISDVARLYRLALEKHETGARYHAVGEEGVSMLEIAENIGRGLKIPVVSMTGEEAKGYFGWMYNFVSNDMLASSILTQKKLGWVPSGTGMIEDLKNMNYTV